MRISIIVNSTLAIPKLPLLRPCASPLSTPTPEVAMIAVRHILLLLVLCTGATATRAGDSSFAVRLGYASPSENLNDYSGTKADGGFALGLDYLRKTGLGISFGGTVELQTSKLEGTAIRVITPMATARYDFGTGSGINVYGLLGVGMNINAVDEDDAGGTYEVDNSLGIKLAVGLEFNPTSTTVTFIEAAYRTDSTGMTHYPGENRFDFVMTSLFLTAGVRWRF